jgi:hypothetical protein
MDRRGREQPVQCSRVPIAPGLTMREKRFLGLAISCALADKPGA